MYALLVATITAAPVLQAPVYVPLSGSALRRHSTFSYKPGEAGYEILFCIASPPKVTLRCVVKTPQDLLVIIEAQATEQGT